MPEDRTVLDHLLDGRDALLEEVSRLTAAIEQLDSVLGRIGGSDRGNGSTAANGATTPSGPAAAPDAPDAPVTSVPITADQVATEPVNPPAEVEPAEVQPVAAPRKTASATKAVKAAKPAARPAKKAPAKAAAKAPARVAQKAAPRARRTGEPPKSIRVHVLEMLAAENRDFGLAEIIDNVHGAGIQAHDDAVRSITIKLMKDGRVERVGRGQYRLARRGAAARAASAATATAPRVTETAPEPPVAAAPVEAAPVEAAPPVAFAPSAPQPGPAVDSDTTPEATLGATESDTSAAGGSALDTDSDLDYPRPDDAPEAVSADSVDDAPADEPDDEPSAEPEFSAVSVPSSYTPPLNLGQPWSGGK